VTAGTSIAQVKAKSKDVNAEQAALDVAESENSDYGTDKGILNRISAPEQHTQVLSTSREVAPEAGSASAGGQQNETQAWRSASEASSSKHETASSAFGFSTEQLAVSISDRKWSRSHALTSDPQEAANFSREATKGGHKKKPQDAVNDHRSRLHSKVQARQQLPTALESKKTTKARDSVPPQFAGWQALAGQAASGRENATQQSSSKRELPPHLRRAKEAREERSRHEGDHAPQSAAQTAPHGSMRVRRQDEPAASEVVRSSASTAKRPEEETATEESTRAGTSHGSSCPPSSRKRKLHATKLSL